MTNFFIALFVTAAITYFLRGLPFLFFTRRPMPQWLQSLGKSLPSAVMACLIVYCLQDTRFDAGVLGLSPLLAALITVAFYLATKSMFLSMLVATASYMLMLYLF